MTESIASETRTAVRARPELHWALRAGVVNYRAAAETLDVDADPDSVATALRRYAEELDAPETTSRSVTVRMQSGVGLAGNDGDADEPDADTVVAVGDERVVRGGEMTAIRVTGDVDASLLGALVGRLRLRSVLVDAAGVAGSELVVVVPRRQGATALQLAEQTAASAPT